MATIHDRLLEILRRHPDGIKIDAIRGELNLGAREQQHLDKRIRELRERFHLPYDRRRGYVLGPPRPVSVERRAVSSTLRAKILYRDHRRCRMCGRTSETPGVELDIDHKVPLQWGGTSDEENLWTLCSLCNEGKRNYFQTFDADAMTGIMGNIHVHARIGLLLEQAGSQGATADLVEFVADQGQWDRRLRELRDLGWEYRTEIRRDARGRRRTTYFLTKRGSLPENPRNAIQQAETRRRERRGGLGPSQS